MPSCPNRPCYSCKLSRCRLFDDGFDTLVNDFTYDEYINLNTLPVHVNRPL